MNLKLGDNGLTVQVLQTLLNTYVKPSPNVREDGQFGPTTRDAVVKFQKASGVNADGVVDAGTWLKLGLRLAPHPMAGASALYPWMKAAHGELLIHQNATPGQHEKRIVEYHSTTTLRATDDETAWCSSFVNWAVKKGGRQGTGSAAAKSWLEWKQGTKLESPREGAVTVIRKKSAEATGAATPSGYHVGFLVSATSSGVRLLGGNQSNRVQYSDFPSANWVVKGHRWPV